jgi:hypothetical protein
VKTKELFPYELAFSMTIHKAQGRTIPKVVLALSHHENNNFQMKYAHIYVAMSRVRKSDDLRFLSHLSGARPGDLGFKYVSTLAHCIFILDYYKGFHGDPLGQAWDSSKSLTAQTLRQKIIK